MEKSPSVLSYARAERLSNGQKVSAIVEWPNGLESPPQIFPLADSLEEAEHVGKFLEERLSNSD